MEMYNTHIHTFRDVDVPEKFLPLGLVRWLAKKDHKFLFWLAKKINPFTPNDVVEKYANFVKTGKEKTQRDIFSDVAKNYPSGTKFIVLPMDMAYMGAGKVPREYQDQLDELYLLPNNVIKFIHIDPRRPSVESLFDKYSARGFKGVKLYPPLGYYPDHPVLNSIYTKCEKNKMCVIAHGSPANPVHFRGSRAELFSLLHLDPKDKRYKKMSQVELCSLFTHPFNYNDILRRYPRLNICIAHFGSIYWDEYLTGNVTNTNWLKHIIEMIHTHDNFWTDVSYTMSDERYWPLLKVMLHSDDKLCSRVLFGSDYYMNEVEGTEREWSIKFRCFIGEDLFRILAVDNPKKFLNL